MLICRENVFAFCLIGQKQAMMQHKVCLESVLKKATFEKKNLRIFQPTIVYLVRKTTVVETQQRKRRRHSGKKLSCDRVLENNRAIHYCNTEQFKNGQKIGSQSFLFVVKMQLRLTVGTRTTIAAIWHTVSFNQCFQRNSRQYHRRQFGITQRCLLLQNMLLVCKVLAKISFVMFSTLDYELLTLISS